MNRLHWIVPLALVTLLTGTGSRAAGIAEQSERLFNSMINVTAPTAHLGQRRGARNRIAAESLWHIVPPSFEAGCGGIDLYAGSFSFINAEQFQALLRSIASNAAGYAFQLAVNAMSREAGELMSKLQDTLQKLNQGFADSCQLAQGLVNDTVSAYQGTLTAKTSQTLANSGIGDIFETWTTSTGQGPAAQAKTKLSENQRAQADLQGNVVWQALKRGNVAARFAGGDDRLLEAIMSVTGSVIVGPPEAAPDGAGDSARITPLRGNVLSVRDLLWGPREHERDPARRTTQVVQRYDCIDRDLNGCLSPQIVSETNLVGLAQYTSRLLLGDPHNPASAGLVEKFRAGNLAFTEAEKAFMELAPHGVGALLRNLGQHDAGMARAFAEQAAPLIALEMVWDIYSIGDAAYLTAVLNAVAMLSGSGDLRTLAGIGFLLGVLLVMFQGIIQARPPPLQHLLVAWVIYLGMFGPTVRVAVEADMAKTFVNYLSECTLYGYNNGTRSADDILRNPRWQDALGSSLVVPTTQLWLGGAAVTKECPDAWTELSGYLVAQYEPALYRSVAVTLGLKNPDAVPGAVNAALDAIAGAGVAAQDYMVMATAAAFLPYAEAKNKRDLLQYQDAVAIEQAAQQRNTQWATEERLFARIVRPMMTFFEAFLFAVSPLMVFAIGLGPLGIRMVGKYLLFGLWIQLWQPILAIINLYLLMTVRFKMDALQDVALGNAPLPSIYAIWKLDFLISDALGVGGMLAASTPAISLMLIYGSAVTATHLAGRLQGGDFINEKITTPDVVNPAAALTVGPLQDHGPLRGTAAPGAEALTWTANVGQELQRDLRSSRQAMERSSASFASALSSAASLRAARSGESFESQAEAWMKDGAKSATDQVLWQTAEGLTRQYSQSGLSTNQMAAILTGGLSGSAGFRGSSRERQDAARAELGSRLQSQYGVQEDLADRMASDISRQVTANDGMEVRVAEALRVDSQTGVRNVFTSQLSSEEASRLAQSSEDVLSASRSLDHAESQAERFGTLGSYNGVPTGATLVQPANHAQNARLEQQIARFNLDGDVQYETHRLLAGGVTADPQQARAMAGMGLLLGHTDGERVSTMTAGERAAAKDAGMAILSDLFNFQTPDGIAADRNGDLSTAVPGHGAARSAVEAAGLRVL